MSKINDGGLLEALSGERGDLDGWLESRSEKEVRAAMLALISPQETLRDKFAAKAMQAALTAGRWRDELARESYRYADAMLKAREEKPEARAARLQHSHKGVDEVSNVIPMHTTRAAKLKGITAYAYFAAKARGLSPIQCEAVMRKARDDYAKGSRPTRAVADARASINTTQPLTAA